MAYPSQYVSSTIFITTDDTDHTNIFHGGRWLETVTSGNAVFSGSTLLTGNYEYFYHTVQTSEYVSGSGTKITITDDSLETVPSGIWFAYHGPGLTGSGNGFPHTTDADKIYHLAPAPITEIQKLVTVSYNADATPTLNNIGTGVGEVYASTVGGVVQLRNIKTGPFISITQDGTDITISGTAISGTGYTDEQAQDAVGTILSGTGSVTVTYDDATPLITISGSPAGIQFASGSYTGDGTTSKAITGVGGQPSVVEIYVAAGEWIKSWVGLGTANAIKNGNFVVQDAITSFDADGFTVSDNGADADPNQSGDVYYWIAYF